MRQRHLCLAFILFLRASAQVSSSAGEFQPAQKLVRELACGNCHPGIPPSDSMYFNAPSLSFAGLRYNLGYLFDYLKQPARVRGHIGSSRMPDFRLDVKDRLALTLFLSQQRFTQQQAVPFPQELATGRLFARQTDLKKLLTEELRCTSCHTFQGEGSERACELLDVGWRLNNEWLTQYLAFPQAFDPQGSMPAFFFATSENPKQLTEMIPGAGQKLLSIAAYLDSAGRNRRSQLDRAFELTKTANPTITATLGEKIFVALNCAACHIHDSIKPTLNAPDLSIEGKRVQHDWLSSYLEKPEPIRPFGFYPGSGSRMPDYKLSSEEVALIDEYVSKRGGARTASNFLPSKLSRFSASKVEKMIREKLACLGCHALDGEGGKIGPDLSHLSDRLQPQFVLEMIREPMETAPSTVMPKIPMDERTQELLASYLLQRNSSSKSSYLALTENPLLPVKDTSGTEGLYVRYCASCHGEHGNGDGYNAKFLPAQPANHASKQSMQTRPDDTLFDGIHSGGTILNKNQRMPAFGATLSRTQIESLVRYLRKLCNCEGPTWSQKMIPKQ